MHAIRQACRVAVPGHQVIGAVALAQQVLPQSRDQTRSLARSIEKACAIWKPSRLAHQRIERRQRAVVDEQAKLAGFVEVGLRCSSVTLRRLSSLSRASFAAAIASSVPPRQ
jgi:hypothetical protein